MNYVTVSAKIKRELYERLKKYNVRISEVIRRALEEEVRRREDEELKKMLEEAKKILRKIPSEELVQAIRSSRDKR